MDRTQTVPMRTYMQLAIGALFLAASTGVLLRFGIFQGMPAWAENFGAVRHAHSHLMYFGWATLAIMAMIWRLLPHWTQAPLPRGVGWQMSLTSIMALLSFPAFWSNGYGLTEIGSLSLPLGSMVSGLNGLTWIAFVWLYVRATAHLATRPLPVQLWDWAIVLLLLAFAGGLGLIALVVLDAMSMFLQQIMLHLFLDLFAAGWFTLALLGLLWGWLGNTHEFPQWLPTQSLALFVAPTFFLGISPAFVPTPIFWVSASANCGAALLLLWHMRALWQRRAHMPALARYGLLALFVQALMAFVLLWPGIWHWSAGTQLRVFYLHNLLLGWISSSLLGLASALWFPLTQPWQQRIHSLWLGGVGLLLLTLLALGINATRFTFSAILWLQIAAWSSVIVAGSIGAFAWHAIWSNRQLPAASHGLQIVAAQPLRQKIPPANRK